MTPEQLNQMIAYFNRRLQDDKNVTKDVYLEAILNISNKDVAEKITNGEAVSYADYKNILLGYQPDQAITDRIRNSGFNVSGLSGYQLENDMFRRNFLFESCYESSISTNKEIDNIMKNDFLGGKDVSDKRREYFQKKPLKTFVKNSENVYRTVFSAQNEQGEPTEKPLDGNTVKQSMTAYKAMKDKVNSCGFLDIILHLPSYFGLKKNLKNLKNSLTEKGLSEQIIDKVDKGTATPTEASMDFLYETNAEYKKLVDEKTMSREAAFDKFTKPQEEEIKKEFGAKNPEAQRPIEKNQRQSAAQSVSLSDAEKNRLREEGESKEGIEAKRFSQFTAQNRLRKKKYDAEAVDAKKPLTHDDLQNPQVKRETFEKIHATAKQAQSVISAKMKKSGKKAPVFNGHERRETLKKLTAANNETNRLMDEYERENEKFSHLKNESREAEEQCRNIQAQIENMSPQEQKAFFAAQPELSEQYARAKATMANFKTESDRYLANKTRMEETLYGKLTNRNELLDRYNKMAGTEREYDSLINGFYNQQTVGEILFGDTDVDRKTASAKEMIERELRARKREMKDRFIDSRADLDRPLDRIKEDEAEYAPEAPDAPEAENLAPQIETQADLLKQLGGDMAPDVSAPKSPDKGAPAQPTKSPAEKSLE